MVYIYRGEWRRQVRSNGERYVEGKEMNGGVKLEEQLDWMLINKSERQPSIKQAS